MLFDRTQALEMARVRQAIHIDETRYFRAVDDAPDRVRTDEARPACNQQIHESKSSAPRPCAQGRRDLRQEPSAWPPPPLETLFCIVAADAMVCSRSRLQLEPTNVRYHPDDPEREVYSCGIWLALFACE